ncbi:hypothetical protein [Cryobacterium mannosilyticum]|uniref:Uncharacterized protein n=1 Tax=Cryobacterium mannosilyticum TaxID=1259190 RepID=A0A4R8WEC3_9MICO|nr:hypothetical protein [Cryobacterium mannosilyticum]TFC07239.1 hypothetical protein E3O32_01550 [Cryobacterium mannosilyticum]
MSTTPEYSAGGPAGSNWAAQVESSPSDAGVQRIAENHHGAEPDDPSRGFDSLRTAQLKPRQKCEFLAVILTCEPLPPY